MMTINESSLDRIANALEKISEEGIRMEVHLYDGAGPMRNDLNAMKINEGLMEISMSLNAISSSLNDIADKE